MLSTLKATRTQRTLILYSQLAIRGTGLLMIIHDLYDFFFLCILFIMLILYTQKLSQKLPIKSLS